MTAPRATLPTVLAVATLATLPRPPKVELETHGEKRHGEGGFTTLRRMSLVTVRAGERSPPFEYDVVGRRALDASVIVAHHDSERGPCVWLRSSLRPPLAVRPGGAKAAVLWELPAGLIEPGESPAAAAARELGEELGFHLDVAAMHELGPPAYPAPALIGELHYYFHAKVDPAERREPEGDGSPVEAHATVVSLHLSEALAACARGEVPDAKTELALRRFADFHASRASGASGASGVSGASGASSPQS